VGGKRAEAIEQLQRRLAVARGEKPAGLLLRRGRLIDLFNFKVVESNIAITDGVIAAVGDDYTSGEEVVDLEGKYVAPGLIDAHLHIESTLLLPPELARVIVGHGTTAVIHDPHEIANVLGSKGVRMMLDAAGGLPCDFFATVPSCVPATDMETAGGAIDTEEVEVLLKKPQVVGFGEMMNYPGLIGGDEEVLKKIIAAQDAGKTLDGHAPAVTGSDLQAYLGMGISTDHECITAAEAAEKLQHGMKIIIRHGSATSSLAELLPLVTETNSGSFMFGCDDREAGELLEKGHINEILRTAVSMGGDPLVMVKLAAHNPARHYRLYDRGVVAPGFRADLAVFDDLKDFRTALVIKDGRVVAREGRTTADIPGFALPLAARDSVKLSTQLKPEDFTLHHPSGRVPVIGVVPGRLVTEKLFIEIERSPDGIIKAEAEKGINKIAVIERHGRGGHMTVGLIKGFGLRFGALASSVAHDSHNIIVVGASEQAMANAVNELGRTGGGFVATGEDGGVKASLPLPAAGLMSTETASQVADQMAKVLWAARDMGTDLPQPFLTLSFMALPVIPSLKITDRGLVDVDSFTFL